MAPAFSRDSHVTITPEQIEQFKRCGAVHLQNVFSPYWVDKARAGIEKNILNPGPHSEKITKDESEGGAYFQDLGNWKSISEFEEFVYQSPAANIVGQLMGSEFAAFYHEHVLVKEPGTLKVTPWHADKPYYPLEGHQACSIWMPVDPVGIESTLQFIEGSHLWGKTFHPKKFATHLDYPILDSNSSTTAAAVYATVPSDEELQQKHRILKWEMKIGDAVVFHINTLHGAPGNNSRTNRRRVLSTRWFGEDAVIVNRPWYVQPLKYGGLQAGDRASDSHDFPIIWSREK